ncbi:hypothetical protein [Algoriphagus antarcticus]|uniref:Uncharacterized protein n=1 Tax=Algoriphagus antarcticus TaxID=238540 RepID=A0A3E0DPG0_9BACT|nr:hypothetical protein [Algoriphagus antarcticus]REG84683.1 hypothetical protein C8N25_11432 [Algoriphagus antarcticus]
MLKTKIVIDIKSAIAKAHSFSSGLGSSSSISKDYLLSELKAYSGSELHITLLDFKEFDEIEFDSLNPTILLTENYKSQI